MAMTAQVKAELASTQVTKACCRKVGGLLDAAVRRRAAHRQRPDRRRGRAGHRCRRAPAAPRHRRDLRPPLRRRDGVAATASARAAGTSSGSSGTARRWPVRPGCSTGAAVRCAACRPQVVSGAGCDAVAAWRGAFLAHGSLTEPGRSSALEVTCPGPGGRPRPGRRRPPARHLGQGPRGPRRRPRGDPRRRRDRRAADPAGRARVPAGLGGAPDAPRGAGHRQPAGQLRRRQPAPLGPGGRRRRCPGGAGPGDPGRRGPRPPARWPASCAWSTSRPRWRSSARCTSRRSPRTPSRAGSAGCWRWPTSGRGPRHPRHRGQPDAGHARGRRRGVVTRTYLGRTVQPVPRHPVGSA